MENLVNKNIGSGITFPIELDNGKPVIKTGIPLIESSIATIIQWTYMTRDYTLGFGTKANWVLEEPVNENTLNTLRYMILKSLKTYETRVNFTSIEVFRKTYETISVYIKYEVKLNKTNHELITDL